MVKYKMGMNEATIQDRCRLIASQRGGVLWRNNVGACVTDDGRLLRFGLGNDSAKLNKIMKSSDLIGITPTLIQPHHVGLTLGVFTAIECKRSDWKLTPGDTHAHAQLNFITRVQALGGIAMFCTDPSELPHQK